MVRKRHTDFKLSIYIMNCFVGDTTFNLAKSVGGKVVAFEMGPTFKLLEQNIM